MRREPSLGEVSISTVTLRGAPGGRPAAASAVCGREKLPETRPPPWLSSVPTRTWYVPSARPVMVAVRTLTPMMRVASIQVVAPAARYWTT